MANENTEMIKLLHASVQDVAGTLGDLREDIGEVKGSLKSLGRSIDNHPKTCPALVAFNKPGVASIPPGMKASALTTWSIRLAPLILAAALGLIGLGFYFASGNADDAKAVIGEVRALADKTVKMSKEIQKVQKEISDGGEQK